MPSLCLSIERLIVALCVAAGCGKSVAPASPDGNWKPTQSQTSPPPSPLDGLVLPARMGPAIGETCPASPLQQGQSQAAAAQTVQPSSADVCGLGGRVAIEEQSSTLGFERALPCDMRPVGERRYEGPTAACVSGDHLVIVSSCTICRRLDAGQVIHAKLSELTPAQHARLAGTIGVPPERAPRTAEAWRALFAVH